MSVPNRKQATRAKKKHRLQAAGTGMALHPGQEGQEAAAGQVLTDPRAAQLGLGQLQQAVRSSFELLQNALHRHGGSGGQGLLPPLLQGSDQRRTTWSFNTRNAIWWLSWTSRSTW